MLTDKILSIQSHVVSGYVGNRSACFPLQLLGFEVDFINTVQLSNHTGYKVFKGQVLDGENLEQLYDGLKQNNLHHYSYLLTGYVGSSSFCTVLIDVVTELKKINPNLFYVCDPVMGDNGVRYVPEDILSKYLKILPMADLITPNQYEAELLTGIKTKTKNDVIQAMSVLHQKGVKIVIISSATFDNSPFLTMFASTVENGEMCILQMEIPDLKHQFTGAGDLFASLLLAWMSKTKKNLKISCENTVNTLHCILIKTLNFAMDHVGLDGKFTAEALELKLVQSKEIIENPPKTLQASSFKVPFSNKN